MRVQQISTCYIVFFFMLLAACNNPRERMRYKGYEQFMQNEKISSVVERKEDSTLTITIPKENTMVFKYNTMLKDVSFVRLETKPGSKIHSLDKLIITPDRIIIADKKVQKEVYIFNREGQFIGKISTKNTILNERILISGYLDATFDFETEEIVLHNQSVAKLYYFDKNGNFKRAQKEYIYFYEFANIPGSSEYIYLNPLGGNSHLPILENSAIYLGKKDTKIEFSTDKAIKDMKAGLSYIINNQRSISNSNKRMFYTPEFSNKVYRIFGKAGISHELDIKLPSPNLLEKLKNQKNQTLESFSRLTSSGQYYYFIGNVLCNNQDIYYIPTFRQGMSGYFYSRKQKKIIAGGDLSRSIEGGTAQLAGYQYPISAYEDYFVSVLHPGEFKMKYGKPSLELLSIQKNMKADDNPVLTFYKLKD